MFSLGVGEMVVLGVIALLLFGKRLPRLMKSMGASIPAFKQGMIEGDEGAA